VLDAEIAVIVQTCCVVSASSIPLGCVGAMGIAVGYLLLCLQSFGIQLMWVRRNCRRESHRSILFLIQLNCGENRRDRFPAAPGKGCPVLIFSYFHRVAVDAEEAGAIVLKTREVATDRLYVPEGTACGRFRLGSESGWGEAELAFEGAIKSRL
jgi:hypothetical protein